MARPKSKDKETIGIPRDPAKSQQAIDVIKAEATKPRRVRKPYPYGPATSSLKPLAQKFVEVLQSRANVGQAQALRIAGHKGSDMAVKKAAYRLMRDPAVLESLKEGLY